MTVFEIILAVVVLGIGLLFSFLNSKFKANKATQDAEQALQLAVNVVQAEYVDALKKASADGTLTEEEKAIAKSMAIDKAKAIATKEGLEVLKQWGLDKLGGFIETIVAKLKK